MRGRDVRLVVQYHARRAVEYATHPDERGAIRREYMFAILRRITPIAAVDGEDGRYYVDTADKGVCRDTFVRGSYDAEVMERIIRVAEDATGVRPLLGGRTFVDVGAHIGTSTIPAIVRFGAADAVAFEPAPTTFRLLTANLAANGLLDRVRAVPVALSDTTGAGEMALSPDDSGDHRVRVPASEGRHDAVPLPVGVKQPAFHDAETARRTVPVGLARFDDIAPDVGIDLARVGLVWIDAQGHEGHVLSGASSLVESPVPVLIEYWPYGLRQADGLDRLHGLIERHYDHVVDVRAPGTPRLDLRELATLAGRYPGRHDFTDLLLVPRRR